MNTELVTAAEHDAGFKEIEILYRSGRRENLKLSAPNYRRAQQLALKLSQSKDPLCITEACLPRELQKETEGFMSRLTPESGSVVEAISFALTFGSEFQKKNASGGRETAAGDGLDGLRAELALIAAGYPAWEVRRFSLPKLRIYFRLTRERQIHHDLRRIIIASCSGMTGEGIKEVYHQMEQELEELGADAQPVSPDSLPAEWEPPTLERIKKRMGMKT